MANALPSEVRPKTSGTLRRRARSRETPARAVAPSRRDGRSVVLPGGYRYLGSRGWACRIPWFREPPAAANAFAQAVPRHRDIELARVERERAILQKPRAPREPLRRCQWHCLAQWMLVVLRWKDRGSRNTRHLPEAAMLR